jgi:1H-pyrrole-2-carbonyl-[peptidyl-carrier protein] brominase
VQSNGKYDVAIVGGGPGGAATALFLLKAGLRPVIIEKERFPRYHIGESLTGETGKSVRELGLGEKLIAERSPVKHGVKVWGANGKNSFWVEVQERTAENKLNPGWTWSVLRSRFDEILLEAALARGAAYYPGEALQPLVDDGVIKGAEFRTAQGATHRLTAEVLVDASGHATFLANRGFTSPKERGEFDKQVAIFNQLRGLTRDFGETTDLKPGNTLIFYKQKHHWAWFIPLDDEIVSIGVVTPSDYFAAQRLSKDEFLRRELTSLNPELTRRMTNLDFLEPTRAASNYSYRCRHFAGRGFLCVGDSHRFIDPIFSFGLLFALKEAEFASQALVRYFNGETRDSENPFAEYEAFVEAGQDVVQDLVDCFWEFPLGFQMLVHQKRRDYLTDLFAGRVYGDLSNNRGLTDLRRALATRQPERVEAAAAYSEQV